MFSRAVGLHPSIEKPPAKCRRLKNAVTQVVIAQWSAGYSKRASATAQPVGFSNWLQWSGLKIGFVGQSLSSTIRQ